MHLSRAALAALVVVSSASASLAHESWLAASDWEPRPGEEVVVQSYAGTGFAGESRPFSAGRVRRLVVRQSSVTDLSGAGYDLGSRSARFIPEDDDGAMVAYETEPVTILMDAADFDDQVLDLGLDGVKRLRQASDFAPQPARQRSARCAKLWIGGNDWRRIKKPIGLPLEIVPRNEPDRVSTLRLRLLFRGKPLANALVKAWMQPLTTAGDPTAPGDRLERPAIQSARTNSRGVAFIDVAKRGEYLISTAHAVPVKDPAEADWDAWWSSLSFARGAGKSLEDFDRRVLRGTGLGSNPDLGDPGFGWSTSLRDNPGWRR